MKSIYDSASIVVPLHMRMFVTARSAQASSGRLLHMAALTYLVLTFIVLQRTTLGGSWHPSLPSRRLVSGFQPPLRQLQCLYIRFKVHLSRDLPPLLLIL